MNYNSAITLLVIFTLIFSASCKKDPLIIPINPLNTFEKNGSIKHMAVSDEQVVFTNSQQELVVIDRKLKQKKFYHKFNSHIQEIFKIQNIGNGQILIGDNKSGLYYYRNDSVFFVVSGHILRDFDYQRQTCWREVMDFKLNDLNDSVKFWPTLQFRQQLGSSNTRMMAFNDTIWVGIRTGLCSMDFNNPKPQWAVHDYSLAHETIQLKVDANDQIWWLTKKYLSIRKNGNWKEIPLPNAITPSDIVVINDTAFISSDYGVFRYFENQIEPVKEINDNLPHQYVTCLTIESNHTLWLGTGAGICTYRLE